MFSRYLSVNQQYLFPAVSAIAFVSISTNCREVNEAASRQKSFIDSIPKHQIYKPKAPYPAWDKNWDGREEKKRENGVTKHYILIRHGQYDESSEDDNERKLTALGRRQAHLTGLRLAEMIRGIDKFRGMPVTRIHVSHMTRAKETAELIATHLPDHIETCCPDPLLNEGIPSRFVPTRPEKNIEDDLAINGRRIELAFNKYFKRSTDDVTAMTTNFRHPVDNRHEEHEVEIFVCHGNVIRYFFCRALQLPPEAWLRFSTFNCSLTYLMVKPNGTVSCRMLGDVGHLGYGNTTFSMNHGFVP
mmetsp:Transcript_19833/g.24457  ORF Transcript_19833/g.24457 Transcript_19833/m.24457 type:complete len:302 (-) Transcript_19833:202-1107(-)|eukprot:CAMPEP_0172493006 /NCGR_PEP_ID=MMETSP1066-20121228/24326_1 /TAXON_ID=671091 /ORGANISM="Coscinodiscus wailesii, Strain CCMP2513" /LENGTH=301 /DNA_ID=CAMNT_0013262939 /DNA_START=208 /DNA_END=1113 /DNA_ORIENTATION=+